MNWLKFGASVQGEPDGVDESVSRSGTLPKVEIAASGSIDKNPPWYSSLDGEHAVKDFGLVFFPHHHVFGQKMWISRAESQDGKSHRSNKRFKLPAASAIASFSLVGYRISAIHATRDSRGWRSNLRYSLRAGALRRST